MSFIERVNNFGDETKYFFWKSLGLKGELHEVVKNSDKGNAKSDSTLSIGNVKDLKTGSDSQSLWDSQKACTSWRVSEDIYRVHSECLKTNPTYNFSKLIPSFSEEIINNTAPLLEQSRKKVALDCRLLCKFQANSLPDGLSVRYSKLSSAGLGVFAVREIKKGTIFGSCVDARTFEKPFSGVPGEQRKKSTKKNVNHTVNGQDLDSSKWMAYINCATRIEDRNIESFPHLQQTSYKAIVDIKEDSELLLWPSKRYNQKRLYGGERINLVINSETTTIHFGRTRQDLDTASTEFAIVTRTTGSDSVSTGENAKKSIKKGTKMEKQTYKCDVCKRMFKNKSCWSKHCNKHASKKQIQSQ